MIARAITVAAVCLAVAPAAGSATPRLVVDPNKPIVGVRTVIELHGSARAPLYVRLTSPTGAHMRLRLAQVQAGLWRTAFHFSDDGQWTLRVDRANALAKVTVFQNGALLPPFRPNQAGGSKAGSLSGIVTPGIIVGR